MKIVSENIKSTLKQPTTQRKGRILVNGNYYDVFNVEYYADAYNEGNVIGNAIASQLDFDLPYMPKFDTFKYFDGVWTGTNYEYVDMGTFTVFDEQDEDEFNKHITSFDNLIKFNAPFQDVGGYPKTLFSELQNVCRQAGVGLNNISIPNGNFKVVNNQFTNGESLKTVLKSICSISGNYATIKNDKLTLQLKNVTNEKLEKIQHEPVVWKRKSYGINQVVIGLSDIEGEYVLRQDDEDIAKNGIHKLVINDNLFAYTQDKREELIDELFNQVKGFGYIPYEMNCEWFNYYEVGDTIVIDDIETIVLRINGKSPKALDSSISAPAIIDSSMEYVDNTNSIENRTQKAERSVDKQNLIIQDVVSQTDAQNQKIAKVTQTVEELNSKISDIAEITISADSNEARIELDNINQSEPIRIVIRPIGESISYLYPNNNIWPTNEYQPATQGLTPNSTLTPSNLLVPKTSRDAQDVLYLKTRTLRFYNKTTEENFDMILPDDLLYYNSEIYDEFILDYDGLSCVINKKLGYNADGSIYVLNNPITIEYEYPHLELTDGDYEISILGYSTAYLFVRLMAQNIYTTQFATKAEVNSEISQTAQSITLNVDKKLENYSTTTEMNAQIQLSASNINQSVTAQLDNQDKELRAELELKVNEKDLISEINASADVINLNSNRLVVNSDNFKLDKQGYLNCKGATVEEANVTGKIYSTFGEIGGWEINVNGLTNGVVKLNSDGSSTIYTVADLIIIRNYIMGIDGFNLPSQMIRHYDLNNDGVVNAQDYVILQNLIGISMS